MSVAIEVERLADIASRRLQAAEGNLREAAQGGVGGVYTPTVLENVVCTQFAAALWERTREYVTTGTESLLLPEGGRLPDTDDPAAALQNLVAGVSAPAGRLGSGVLFPMDEAFTALEKREHGLWREACLRILEKYVVPAAP